MDNFLKKLNPRTLTCAALLAVSVLCTPHAKAQAEVMAMPAEDIPVDPSTIVKYMSGAIIDKTGTQIGTISAAIGKHGTMLDISASGLAPGKHGMHMHAIGQCDPETGFKSAGGHIVALETFDPPSLAPGHGLLYAEGHHAGDLPNLIVGEDGTATTQVFSASLVWDMLADKDGAALIIHDGTDDHMTQPLGGSGGRAACGALSMAQ